MIMKKEITIKIKGNQYRERRETGPEGFEETIDRNAQIQECPAVFYDKDGVFYVLYEEISEDEPDPIKVTLKFDGSSMELTKRGLLNSRMIFKENESFKSDYVTPFGTFTLGTFTKEYSVSPIFETIDRSFEGSLPKTINLHAVYDMEINDEFASENEITVILDLT